MFRIFAFLNIKIFDFFYYYGFLRKKNELGITSKKEKHCSMKFERAEKSIDRSRNIVIAKVDNQIVGIVYH